MAAGFYGKLPVRGDFLRAGLPRDAIDAWDLWLQRVFGPARALLGPDWEAAWLQAPVWRFALPPGQCGAAPLLGLWMPSVDAAGRHFPLLLAASPASPVVDDPAAESWLDAAEDAGRQALAADLTPEALAALLPPPPALADAPIEVARWWSEGSPLVPPTRLTLAALPDETIFAAMVRAELPVSGAA